MSLYIDFSGMNAVSVGDDHGVSKNHLKTVEDMFESVHHVVLESYTNGNLPFWDLPFQHDLVDEIDDYASGARKKFDNVVVLGIGGSALGPIALHTSLNHLQHNLIPAGERSGCRFFCPDNVDPDLVESVFDVVDTKHTLFNVISKSGGTAETAAQFLIIQDMLQRILGEEWKDHLVITTDPEKGFLHDYALKHNIKTFPVPHGVGGRFTVLSPVGLLPAAMTGIDIRALCEGAAALKQQCLMNHDLATNPAGLFSALLYISQHNLGKPIHVLFAYSNRLYPLADWFRQLWAESLGKRYSLRGEEINTGPTPVKAIGATDQHSQVQLYVEGPNDKAFVFLGTRTFKKDIKIPALGYDADETGYLENQTLSGLLNAERKATAYALTEASRPNMTIELDCIDEKHIGALMYLLEAATIYAGGFYGVNPLDQPGVEAGKLATYALMGRDGYEEKREQIEKKLKHSDWLELKVP